MMRQETTAPRARLIDALSGAKAPDTFMAALSEADDFVKELDGLRELQCRVAELTIERDNLASDLADLREAHQVTVNELARARRERDNRYLLGLAW